MITVASVLVQANVPYTVEYVERLQAMCRKYLDEPFRMVCFTDRPANMPSGVEPIQTHAFKGLPGWWSKLHVFRDDVGLTGRVLYLDLDVLIVASLHAIAKFPSAFATIPDGGSTFQPKDGRKVIKRFNSSVMVFDAGVLDDLYRDWTPAIAARLWGDQDMLAERFPAAATMPLEWFPRLSTIGAAGVIPPAAKVILAKKPKPVEACTQWPWFAERWRAA